MVFALAATAIVASAIIFFTALVVGPLMERAANHQAAVIELAANTYFELPADRRAEFEIQVLVNHGLLVSTIKQDMPEAVWDSRYFSLLGEALTARFGSKVSFFEDDDHYWVNLPNPNESTLELQIGFSSELPYLTQQIVGIAVVVLAAIIVMLASYVTVRRIARPLERASNATEQFRGTFAIEHLPVEGPKELRLLAANFNQMAHEITELIENRTALLAGISHDIRTPLTRMRLALELNREELGEDVTEQLTNDLAQMDELVENALEYASGTQETPESVPFDSFLSSLVDGIAANMPIHWEGERNLSLELAASAFSRVITNLIANAVEHANDVSLLVEVEAARVLVHVKDHGRGIPFDEREKVFRPFYRIDAARGGERSHSGLGLAIVKQLCDNFGWTISLSESEGGGTDACVAVNRARTE
ncbi:MAG: HAMP domain-containing protein [Gammaproteobacteria bacterium]|nr:HAMP domain-containing protein [Gammaproteobacteria bacterium]